MSLINFRTAFTIVLLWLLTSLGYSQETPLVVRANFCGTEIPSQQWENEFQRLISELNENNTERNFASVPIVIPVIIHVIHTGQAVGTYPNLAQGQLESQIKVLNNDFAGIGYNYGNYPIQAFSTWASAQGIPPANTDPFGRIKIADCNVQFCLALQDSMGNNLPEPGIERIDAIARGWPNPASINAYTGFKNLIDNTIKPQTIWNVSKYMNIWITDENINAVGLLGYATFPYLSGLVGLNSAGTSSTDGFWCYSKAFGSVDDFPTGTYYNSNNRGRTSTHEIGHYLGLRHVWGDGNCANDYCADTPPASASNFNSPAYPYKISNCSGNSPDGEMFMNFMDYTNDDAKYMCTQDQALRVQTAMANSPYRKFLGTHNLCSLKEIAATSKFSVIPSVCGSTAAITLSNQSSGVPAPSYTWSASGPAVFYPNNNSGIASVSFSNAGTHTITLTTNNGTISTSSKTIIVHPPPVLLVTSNSSVECLGAVVSLTASGGNWYTWQPGNFTGNIFSYTASGQITYTCTANGNGNCKTSGIVVSDPMDCTSLSESGGIYIESVFPNPCHELIEIRIKSPSSYLISIADLSGAEKYKQRFQNEEKSLNINMSNLSSGMYLLTITDSNGFKRSMKIIKN